LAKNQDVGIAESEEKSLDIAAGKVAAGRK
jgi:hypothetical protein